MLLGEAKATDRELLRAVTSRRDVMCSDVGAAVILRQQKSRRSPETKKYKQMRQREDNGSWINKDSTFFELDVEAGVDKGINGGVCESHEVGEKTEVVVRFRKLKTKTKQTPTHIL